jgi:hypothetical protein
VKRYVKIVRGRESSALASFCGMPGILSLTQVQADRASKESL